MKLIDFDTIIFDLDETLWSGSPSDIWAKKLIQPWILTSDTLTDLKNQSISLQPNVRNVLKTLNGVNKNIGFITNGGLINLNYNNQPTILALKLFDIYQFFNFIKIVGYRSDDKSNFFKECGKTIFIDDNYKNLYDIKEKFPNTTTINRKFDFKDWGELL